MLILKRHEGESVYMGEDIKVTFFQQGRNYVQLGFQAPRHVRILRAELRGIPDPKGQVFFDKTRLLEEIEL